MAKPHDSSTSFSTRRINATTFVIREDDSFAEHPLIYAKLHPKAPVIVLSDTGSDAPSEEHKHDKYIHLRAHLEHCPIPDNNYQPLNPSGKLKYIIICTHCHYDHILGVPQFLRGGTTEIIASAAGRDFIESDLEDHGEFEDIGRPTPFYQVTKWAQAFERLQYPFEHDWDARGRNLPCADAMPNIFLGMAMSTQGSPPVSVLPTRLRQAAMQQSPPSSNLSQKRLGTQLQRHQPPATLHTATILDNFDFDAFLNETAPSYYPPAPPKSAKKIDLGITIIQTPGHTPDELAWYDHDEMHLYVGDSFYREGDEDEMPIIFPRYGNLIEWVFAMQKLAVFVRSENARAAAIVDDGHAEGKDETESSGDEEDDWVHVPASSTQRVEISCAHQTYSVDGAEILAELESFSFRVFKGDVPVVETKKGHGGETYDLWREKGEKRTPMSIFCPRRLMEDARRFFGHAESSK
ncbi:hypothetical protein LTR91_011635 [Friedmanniomyces endolithicus]|uniref:Metallo-beta-lactamase domain-containing protein n=1 Tax=Friedmanniomyces endolithicus TaxID=329885 RepID=A0AAN6KHF3_9PEZI|nr:hypothetical protein LTR35_007694 [Friedmanniomyces endolithicus]KAK0295279.1 hypothetical protein LTS00_006337 [Friedmanniomyces endolithicus]KAK0318660.1 hypothetical protein LTR82_010402 [Friedmanniomyces endolithicus]KAK0903798.1 hypothetical protein LTR57_019036 [Friedmanniomyces endolithicus]KAK0982387.1 hypothetical protein LTR91_011635 [Friedmanniomyces endolithicus]